MPPKRTTRRGQRQAGRGRVRKNAGRGRPKRNPSRVAEDTASHTPQANLDAMINRICGGSAEVAVQNRTFTRELYREQPEAASSNNAQPGNFDGDPTVRTAQNRKYHPRCGVRRVAASSNNAQPGNIDGDPTEGTAQQPSRVIYAGGPYNRELYSAPPEAAPSNNAQPGVNLNGGPAFSRPES